MHKLKFSIFSLLEQRKEQKMTRKSFLIKSHEYTTSESGKHARDDWNEKILEWEIFAVIFYRTLAAYSSDNIKLFEGIWTMTRRIPSDF